MFKLLIALFILFPLLEISLLIKIGQNIGLLNVLHLTLITGLLGFIVLKTKAKNLFGHFLIQLIKKDTKKENLPNQLLYLTSGVLLMLPGFLSDLIGLSMLFHFIRKIYLKVIKKTILQKLIPKKLQFMTFKTKDMEEKIIFKEKFHESDHEAKEENNSTTFSNIIDFNSRRKKDH